MANWRKEHLTVTLLLLPENHNLSSPQAQVLLLHRNNTGNFDQYWDLPTGKVEVGETPIEAAIREAEEELGIIVTDLRGLGVIFLHGTMIDLAREEAPANIKLYPEVVKESEIDAPIWCNISFIFRLEQWKGTPYNNEPEKHDNIGLFSLSNLPQPLTPISDHILPHLNNNEPIYQEIFYRWTSSQERLSIT